MPPATARANARTLVVSSPLIMMPPVTPAPKASSDTRRPVRPRRFCLISALSALPRTRALRASKVFDGIDLVQGASTVLNFRPQPKALNLSSRCFRQFGAELDPARVLVNCELLLAVLLQG